jgi:hypothetical protein
MMFIGYIWLWQGILIGRALVKDNYLYQKQQHINIFLGSKFVALSARNWERTNNWLFTLNVMFKYKNLQRKSKTTQKALI